jgi:hypothetical protein
MEVGLCDHHVVCVSPPINFGMTEPIFMKLGKYIMACEPISKVSMCIPLALLGNGLVNTLLWQ